LVATLSEDTFAASSKFSGTSPTGYEVTGLPGTGLAGELKVTATRTSDTKVTFSLTGTATNALTAAVPITITFTDAAFTDNAAEDVTNYEKTVSIALGGGGADATISAYSLGGVTGSSSTALGTPKATWNDANIVEGAVTLTTAQATSPAFNATATAAAAATLKYAYTANGTTAPTFATSYAGSTIANNEYVWIEVTNGSTVLIYKIKVTVTP
jgi:hypothetical protein